MSLKRGLTVIRSKSRLLAAGVAVAIALSLGACQSPGSGEGAQIPPSPLPATGTVAPESGAQGEAETSPLPHRTGTVAKQVLHSSEGDIHYSYNLPEGYDPDRAYPLMVAMPGYDMMWFGEGSSGSNLTWRGFLCWTELEEDMIVVSAQLTDWGETSAKQAVELTEYFLENFSVDPARVYAAGYSAGGETMSRAVSMRPDLYAAYPVSYTHLVFPERWTPSPSCSRALL